MTAEACATQVFSGWGRLDPHECQALRPEKQSQLANIRGDTRFGSLISRGLGRSYGDAAVNHEGVVILHGRLNRLLSFDADTGVLECEAGTSFAEIISVFLPRGFFLPVTPGTKFVTVGGAIANDVHGKNHHRDGSIANFVQDLELLLPSGERLRCSRDEHAELFWATLGGIGLTGVIVSARLRLVRVPSAYVAVDYRKAPDLEAAFAALEASDAAYTYSVAWIDCLARGRSLGRSVLMQANPAPQGALELRSRPKLAIPFEFPGFALNGASIRAFNEVFYRKHRNETGRLVDYDAYFYPLDAIADWNRMYGRRGFAQYQVALPPDSSFAGIKELLERLSSSSRASFLAVLKRFGAASGGWLSFPMPGYTLALDIPYSPDLPDFLHELDRRVLEYGGRLYLAKDALARPETIAAMYPRLDEFRALRARIDPQGRMASDMARRLQLV